jgi:hypothetical protein
VYAKIFRDGKNAQLIYIEALCVFCNIDIEASCMQDMEVELHSLRTALLSAWYMHFLEVFAYEKKPQITWKL